MEVKRMLTNVRLKVSTYVMAVAMLCCVDTAFTQTSNERTLHAPDSSSTLSVSSRDYVISPDDLLDIFIVDVPELSRQYRISTSGQLNFPLIPKPIDAAGNTLEALSQRLRDLLQQSGTLTDPRIIINVKESRLHSIAITGAVKKPQIYEVMGPTRILDLLSFAGGLADNAGPVVRITRSSSCGQSESANGQNSSPDTSATHGVTTLNLRALLSAPDAKLNVNVCPGDWVTVPPADVIYVVGAVNKSGGFQLTTEHDKLSVMQAIALAEYLKPSARRNDALIIRRNLSAPSGRMEIAVNLRRIFAGKSPDVPLQPDDILFVPESAGKKILTRGAEAAIQVATGVAIYRPY
jgi:polysaccharide export outer membrane protein